ncbi:MAG: efflux RND transporter permease subunit [Caulobacteraceae bacterium]
MLGRLIQVSLGQRWLVMLLAVVLLAAAAAALNGLPVDAFPDISPTQAKIILKAPGMTPEEVESQIVSPLEAELLGIPKQTMLRTTSKYGISDVTVDFQEGTDVYWARQQVSERLANVMGQMPASVTGGLSPISTPLSDVIMFTLEGGDLTLEQRRSLIEWTLRPQLRSLPGVADVNVLGGRVKTFEVQPNPIALAQAGLTAAQLRDAIQRNNRNDGSGRLVEGEQALIVRAVGAAQTIDDLANTVVSNAGGRIVRLSDVATVRVDSLTRYGAVTKDGKGEAAEALVLSLRCADASAVVKAVNKRLDEMKSSLPHGVRTEVFYNRAELISRAVGTVTEALLEATVLVVILLFLFLGDVRAAVTVAVTLPFAVLLTLLVMRNLGMSANLMSLGGLAVAIGMLVDGAVVVVENTVERLSQDHHGEPKLMLVARAAREVAAPVAAGVLIICLVFTPLLTLQGLEGKMFRPVALTIVIALAGSLLLSLTLVPVLSSFVLKSAGHHSSWLMDRIGPAYDRLLAGALRKPKIVYAAASVGVVLAGVAYTVTGKSFMPTMDEGTIVMQLAKLPSVGLDRSAALDGRIQDAVLKAVPEVRHMICRVGSDELGLDPMGLNESDCFMQLAPKKTWRKADKQWLQDQVRTAMDRFPGVDISFTQPIEMRTSEMLTGSRGALAIKIFGPDISVLSSLAGQVKASVGKVPGATDVYTVANDSVQYLRLDIDRLAAGRYGLQIDQLQDELHADLEGMNAGLVREPDRRTPIIVRGPESLRSQPEAFAQLELATPDGGVARVSDVARLSRADGPVKIDRENASRFAVIQSNVTGRDLVGFVKDAQAAVAQNVKLPAGYRITWGGQFENQRRAAARLGAVIPIALAGIFLVLFLTLRSVRQTVLILANVPFALVGGVLALALFREYLSVPASVGFIALLGIAVLNGLVLVSYFNQLQMDGRTIDYVVTEGARRRLRPVLMTASITAFGLAPLLFASGPGSEIQRPLAIVVVGGLITSTLLTLVLLPILYKRFCASKTPGIEAIELEAAA